MEELLVQLGPKFLLESDPNKIQERLQGSWASVMRWSGFNGGANSGLLHTKFPLIEFSGEINPSNYDTIRLTDHRIFILKKLSEHFVSKY